MSTDTADATDDGGESTGGVRETLADAYREYVGEPDEERDIYVGFGLFFGGIALGVVGLLLFLYSGLQEPETTLFWQSREIALVAGLLGLPSVVLSIVVLLPVGRRTRLVSGVGAGLCLLAVGILIVVYPYDWTESATLDGSVITISVYSVGLVALSAATGASLVAQYLDAAAPDETTEGAADSDDGESVSDEAVAADIESAMDDAGIGTTMLDIRAGTEDSRLADWFGARRERFSLGATYDDDPEAYLTAYPLGKTFDALCFVPRTTRARPL